MTILHCIIMSMCICKLHSVKKKKKGGLKEKKIRMKLREHDGHIMDCQKNNKEEQHC